eukprot:gene7943-15057_t
MLRLHGGSALEVGREALTEDEFSSSSSSSARPSRSRLSRATAVASRAAHSGAAATTSLSSSSSSTNSIPADAAAPTTVSVKKKKKKGGFMRTLKRSVRRSKRGNKGSAAEPLSLHQPVVKQETLSNVLERMDATIGALTLASPLQEQQQQQQTAMSSLSLRKNKSKNKTAAAAGSVIKTVAGNKEMEAAAAEAERDEQDEFVRQMEEAAHILAEEEAQSKAAAEQKEGLLKLEEERKEQDAAAAAAAATLKAEKEHEKQLRQDAETSAVIAVLAASAAAKVEEEKLAAAEEKRVAAAAQSRKRIAAEAASAEAAEAKLVQARAADKAKRDAALKPQVEQKRREPLSTPTASAPLAASTSPAARPAEAGQPAAKKRRTSVAGQLQALKPVTNIQSRKLPSIPAKHARTATNSASDADEEKLDERALKAAAWTDKEIRKLISEIKSRGYTDDDGKHAITFGQLFEETDQIFDALSGICKTAKKYKVLAFDAEQLWQGQNDSTVITLLKETHDGVKLPKRRARMQPSTSRKGFGERSLKDQNLPCHVCSKTVYPMEFVGASDNAFHKACFRCSAHHREAELSWKASKTSQQQQQQQCVRA